MSEKLKASLIKYGITTAIGLAIAYLVCELKDLWKMTCRKDIYHVLCDAFTLPGTLIFCLACLVWLANKEYFVSLGYAFSRAAKALVPFGRTHEKHETFHDYVLRKREKEPVKGYGFLFVVGLAFLALALLFLALYEKQN